MRSQTFLILIAILIFLLPASKFSLFIIFDTLSQAICFMTINQDEHISAILSGDMKGLQRIYDLYLNRIARFITSKGGNAEDAKDIFQDALIIIYEKAQQANFTLSSQFYTFLYGICRNLWGNRLKKKRTSGVINSDDETYTSEEDIQATIEAEEENQVFWDAFDQIGEDCQKLMHLFFEKRRMDEISTIMGHGSVNYTKKRKYKCKEKILDWIRQDIRYTELKL